MSQKLGIKKRMEKVELFIRNLTKMFEDLPIEEVRRLTLTKYPHFSREIDYVIIRGAHPPIFRPIREANKTPLIQFDDPIT